MRTAVIIEVLMFLALHPHYSAAAVLIVLMLDATTPLVYSVRASMTFANKLNQKFLIWGWLSLSRGAAAKFACFGPCLRRLTF